MRASLALATLLAFPVALVAQPVHFTYRLGKDTVAIERYERSAARVTGEMVQRSGAVVTLTRYEMTLGRDGRPTTATVRRTQADGAPLANQPSETRFAFGRDTVVREAVRGDETQRQAFAMRDALLALPVFVYGPMELLAARRRGGAGADSVPVIGLGGSPGTMGLVPAGGDTLRLRGGPYPMRLVFDRSGLLQAIDGAGTTNKILASREAGGPDLATIARTLTPTGTLSARDVARGAFGAGGMVLVDFGRPHVRERTVWGGALVPFDSVWRAGANDATHLFTTRTLTFEGLTVPPGSYTLWVQHTRDATYLIVNKRSGIWGTMYAAAEDLGRVVMQSAPAAAFVEELTYAVHALGGNRGAIELAWGDRVMTAPFTAAQR